MAAHLPPLWRLAVAAAALAKLASCDQASEDSEVDALRDTEGNLVAGVIDGRTFYVFGTLSSKLKKQHWRIAGIEFPQEQASTAKRALASLIDKKRIYMKALPDELQGLESLLGEVTLEADEGPDVLLGDVWTEDGRHVARLLIEDGHAISASEDTAPKSERFSKDAPVAALKEAASRTAKRALKAVDEEKEKSMKEIADAAGKVFEEVAAEREAQRKAAEVAAKAAEDDVVEPAGIGLWIGAFVVLAIVMAALMNFGRPVNKKINLNRKRGWFEQQLRKLKGS